MKDSIIKVAAVSLFIALSGCVSVRERQPDTVSTTTTTRRTTTVPTTTVPATSTTVERTTVY